MAKRKLTPAQKQIAAAKRELKKRASLQVRAQFLDKLIRGGIPAPKAEYVFHPVRKWQMDYAWPDHMIFLEVEGGVWTKGRHTNPSGFLKDMEKYNMAISMGWRGPLRCQPSELMLDANIDLIRRTLNYNRGQDDSSH